MELKLTEEEKQKILSAIKKDREYYPSNNKHAVALGIPKSVYSSLINGKTDKKLSPGSWITIARRLGVALRDGMEWKAAETPTYLFITEQLRACQESGVSAVLCDQANIGKTFSAKAYVKIHGGAVYVDCSQVKTKQRLVRYIAKEFGLNAKGRYCDVYDDLAYYMKSTPNPLLVVLDEAGDLDYPAFLELKALWNAAEQNCAWYMMGADGLRAKITRSIEHEKVGYTEMFSRYGGKFCKVTPDDGKEREVFLKAQAAMVVKVNAPGRKDVAQIVNRTGGSLRRVHTEIEKLRREEAHG